MSVRQPIAVEYVGGKVDGSGSDGVVSPRLGDGAPPRLVSFVVSACEVRFTQASTAGGAETLLLHIVGPWGVIHVQTCLGNGNDG